MPHGRFKRKRPDLHEKHHPQPRQRRLQLLLYGYFLTGDVSDLLRVLDPRRQTVGHNEPHEPVGGERAADVAVELVGDGGMSPVPPLPGPAESSQRVRGR